MSGVNKVILIGRTGRDPEVRHLDNGNTVASLSLATSESYKDKNTGERKEQTEWHNLSIWGKLAEVVVKYVKKGDMLYVEGKLRTRSWEKDGVTRYTTEVLVQSMTMLGGKQSEPAGRNQDIHPTGVQGEVYEGVQREVEEDDLPF